MTIEELREMAINRKTVEITEENVLSYYPTGVCNNLNMSDINSLLIKQAAKHCQHYASDVVIDINSMERKILELAESAVKGEVTAPAMECVFFGFRDMGVDGTTFVRSRIGDAESYGKIGECYKAIYVAEISAGEPKRYYPVYVDVKVHFYGFEFAQEGGEGKNA